MPQIQPRPTQPSLTARLGQSRLDHVSGHPGRWPAKNSCLIRAHQQGMDNNTAERDMPGPVVGRKNFFGSGSLWSGQLACTMYSLLATLKLYGINERIWLGDFLQACADRSGQALGDVSAFMPWSMSARQLAHMRGAGLSKSKSKSRAKVHGRAAVAASVPEEVNSS